MATKADVEAAVEMANEGLGFFALIDIILSSVTIRHVENGVIVATSDGPVTIDRPHESKWRAC